MAPALRAWWPAGAVAAAILVATTAPIRGPEGTPDLAATVAHVAMFAALAAALAWGWRRRGSARPLLGPAVATTAYGAATEGLQLLLPHRSGDPADVVADAAGAVLGTLIARTVGGRSRPAPARPVIARSAPHGDHGG